MKLYRQVILLTLMLLVLVSSTGMAVGMHLCGGELRDVTFFGAEADCPMEQKQAKATPPCHAQKDKAPKDDVCCQDHEVVMDGHDALAGSKALTLHKLQDLKFLATLKVVVLQFLAPESAKTPSYTLYTSPPLARDIPVLVQSFLL